MSDKIKSGLKNLGVKGHVIISRYNDAIISVSVNGALFGLWDIYKNTFVA